MPSGMVSSGHFGEPRHRWTKFGPVLDMGVTFWQTPIWGHLVT